MNCAICYEPLGHHGNNPDPILDAGQPVCDLCNLMFVVPARIGMKFSLDHARVVAARLKEAK